MRVAFTDYVQPDLDLETRLLTAAGVEPVVGESDCATPDEVIALARDSSIQALVVQYAPITGEVLQALPHVRIVSLPQVGLDSVDLGAAIEHGVWITNVPDGNMTEVATHALAMSLSLIRQLPLYDRSVRAGEWNYEAAGVLRRPGVLTFGLLGLGRIGRMVAKLADPCFGRILAHDPYAREDDWPSSVERADAIEQLFRESDVLSLHLPLSDESRGLVGQRLLSLMKPGSFLVNVSRGPILEIPALLSALDDGGLAGAALDVLPEEPPTADSAVLDHPKVLLSPHAAFYSQESDEEMRRRSIENILALYKGGRPPDTLVEGWR